MKTFAYGENVIELFRYLRRRSPERIFSDGHYRVVFDYGDHHISALPESVAAASQNDSDEAIRAEFKRIDSAFQPDESDKLLFQHKAVNRLWILRTLLYFTDDVLFGSEAEALGNFRIETETDKAIADVLRQTTGGHDEIVCHPRSEEAAGVNKEFANMVDAGIMLEINGEFLMCFSLSNGFWVVGKTMTLDELAEEVTSFYEFVEL